MKRATDKRMAVWRHNGHIGSAVMMQKQTQAIMDSPTATPTAKIHASAIWGIAKQLEEALRAERKPL